MEFILSLISIGLSIYAVVKVKSAEKERHDAIIKGYETMEKTAMEKLPPLPPAPSPITPQEKESNSPSEISSIERFGRWFAADWMLKTGAILILLGFLWLVSYAFLHNWIGPAGRITLGIVSGAAILLSGEFRLRKVKSQGITLCWLGASIMVISIYAGQYMYEIFSPFIALLFILVSVGLTTTISIRHSSFSLSLASFVIASLAPLLINSKDESVFGLYSYLFIITCAVIWISWFTRWRSLTLLSIGTVTLYSLPYISKLLQAAYIQNRCSGLAHCNTKLSYYFSFSPMELLVFKTAAITFISLYFFTNLITMITHKKITVVDIITAAAVGLFSLLWINTLTPNHLKGIMTLTTALSFSMGAFMVFSKTANKYAVYVYSAVAILLLAVATGFEFEGPILAIAFSIEALILPVVAVELLGAKQGKWLLLYFILPLYFGLESVGNHEWSKGLLHNSFYSLTLVTLTTLMSSTYFYYKKREDQQLHRFSVALIIIGMAYLLTLIWKSSHALIESSDIARTISLFIYTVIGLYCYITGQIQKRIVLYWFGLILLLGVISRLLLVEVWNMELMGRIITFFSIGGLLIGSVFIRKSRI